MSALKTIMIRFKKSKLMQKKINLENVRENSVLVSTFYWFNEVPEPIFQ